MEDRGKRKSKTKKKKRGETGMIVVLLMSGDIVRHKKVLRIEKKERDRKTQDGR